MPFFEKWMLAGIKVLKTNPKNNELDPITKHKRFSIMLNGTVFIASPANCPIEI
jgi:hypothetical protein